MKTEQLFAALEQRLSEGTVILAVEGGSAAGKTTLGNLLCERYGGSLFHMDDFFLRPEQRTPERFAEPGGNVDRERFLTEVLQPRSKGETVVYRPFSCSTFTLGEPVTVPFARLTVVEGAYSMHPMLCSYYDFSVFLEVSGQVQRERILKRNSPEQAEQFFNRWIPLEQQYFEALNIKEQCDMVIKAS